MSETDFNSPKIKVESYTFRGLLRYAEGHQLTEHEALALNKFLHDSAKSGFRASVTKAIELAKKEGREALTEQEVSDLQSELLETLSTYDFKTLRKPRESVPPVIKEARKLIKPLVLNFLKTKGVDPDSLGDERMEKLLDQALEKRPDVMNEAKRRVEAIKSLGDEILALE
jgi:hypothetical protein